MKPTAYDGTTTPGTQPRKKMTMGQVDTSDLMMIKRRVTNISSWSPKLEWASLTHTTPYIVVTERTDYILDTLSTEYTQQAFMHTYNLSLYVFNASEQICMMMIMRGSSMHKSEHNPKAIMYPAYGTHHRLCCIQRK